MIILAIQNGEYGIRHIENIQNNKPDDWVVHTWQADTLYPPVIDYPEDYLPDSLPRSDLIISLSEHRGVAELLPDIAELAQAKSVLAPVDNESWLPRGLARQLHEWLDRIDVFCATPKPLCSLTESSYFMSMRNKVTYTDEYVSRFAQRFGKPTFSIEVNSQGLIEKVQVERDAVCGCARFVAEKITGQKPQEAAEKAGLAHHHFPCLASMGIDPDFQDTLMHVSGNIMKDSVKDALGDSAKPQYIRPHNRSD